MMEYSPLIEENNTPSSALIKGKDIYIPPLDEGGDIVGIETSFSR